MLELGLHANSINVLLLREEVVVVVFFIPSDAPTKGDAPTAGVFGGFELIATGESESDSGDATVGFTLGW